MAHEMIGTHRIEMNENYFIAYAGGKRELPEKDQKEYNKILGLPFVLQRKELSKIPFEKNPNVIPVTGRQLMAFIRELKFVPMFDTYFNQSHLIQLSDFLVYESIKAKSYEMALKNGV